MGAPLGGKAWAGFWLVVAVLPKALARQEVLLHHGGVVWRMTLKLLQCIASNFRNMETFAFRENPPCTLCLGRPARTFGQLDVWTALRFARPHQTCQRESQ